MQRTLHAPPGDLVANGSREMPYIEADGPGFAPDGAPRLVLDSHEVLDPQGGLLLHYRIQHKE